MDDGSSGVTDFWKDDYLKRKDEARYLTKYLLARYQAKKNENGFVLAVNGDWGLGKSFMIERWSKELEHIGHPTVMFNSWENDFTPEPLVAFISELNSALSTHFDKMPTAKEFRRKWLSRAKAVLVPSAKVAGLALLKHGAGVGLNDLKALWETDESAGADEVDDDDEDEGHESKIDTKELREKLEKVVEDELKSHTNVKQAIKDFKSQLAALVDYLDTRPEVQLPIFVYIDELDRCRPDYAIKLLEGIKHLFGIPGIHFIVATNLPQLAHSVRAVYGEKFDAERYLKRFFDMEYSLPEPEGIEFAAELMSPLADLTEANFITGLDRSYRPDEFPAKNLSYIFFKYALTFGLTLRDQQQAAKVMEACLLTFGKTSIHIHFLMFLVALYQKNSQVYHEIAQKKNISNNTGYPEIAPNRGAAQFSVADSSTNEGVKNVSTTTIAELYFSTIEGSQFNGQSNADFPNCLVSNYRNEQQRGTIAKYLEIVRRAGQFSE